MRIKQIIFHVDLTLILFLYTRIILDDKIVSHEQHLTRVYFLLIEEYVLHRLYMFSVIVHCEMALYK